MNFNNTHLRNGDEQFLVTTIGIPRTEQFHNYFCHRVIRLWNTLPLEIREIEFSDTGSNSLFKNKIREFVKVDVVNAV